MFIFYIIFAYLFEEAEKEGKSKFPSELEMGAIARSGPGVSWELRTQS